MECGELLSTEMMVNNFTRRYSFYYPDILCDSNALRHFTSRFQSNQSQSTPFDVNVDRINVPIFLLLHGYTDDPARFLDRWKWDQYANQNGFILLLPRGGVNNARVPSWNAQSCCGENLAQNIDDVSFIREAIYQFSDNTANHFPFIDVSISNLTLFISCHSNGCFMADKLTWIYANTPTQDFQVDSRKHYGFPIKIVSLASMSAFIYNNTEFLEPLHVEHESIDNMNGHNKVSVFYQFGDSDHGVDHRGCGCPGAHCCCGIKQHSQICFSLKQAYLRWMEWNELESNHSVHSIDEYVNGQIRECFVKNENRTSDNYSTKMCLWKGAGHGVSWDKHVDGTVLRQETIDFFLDSLCFQPNTLSQKRYFCPNITMTETATQSTDIGSSNISDSTYTIKVSNVIIGGKSGNSEASSWTVSSVLFVTLLVAVASWTLNRLYRRYKETAGYRQVNLFPEDE